VTASDRLALEGRVVVVAGAGGGGIGTAVCRAVAEAGASVLALDVRPEAMASVEVALAATAGPHRSVVADVGDPVQVAAAVDEAGTLGTLHGLVHVAGGLRPGQWAPLLSMPLETWDEVVALNLRAALVTMRTVAARLVAGETGGSIVSVSSVAGLSAMPFGASYAASKAGLMSLTRTAALEWGRFGIRVNTVAPGTVRTPKNTTAAALGDHSDGDQSDGDESDGDESDGERAVLPLRRRGVPDDIAGAALFLLSDLSAWITGQVLAVDGGSSIRPSFLDEDDLPVFVHNEQLRQALLLG
jgi:NAD(P)-dependent dehydrogenase (short-subunit alcohol dehydrogenase family)